MFSWLGRPERSARDSVRTLSPGLAHEGPRRLFIHAGLHKTGTTALQAFLSSAADELRQFGVLYPRTGVNKQAGYGHHNIAWEMARDRRFMRAAGTIGELAIEVANFDGNVILSSEDFETIIDDPDGFAPLRMHPGLSDREFIFVVYVRNQVAYAESLFLELIHHGIGDEFARFVRPVFHDQKIRLREWTYQFDYAHIYKQWQDRSDARLIMRNYHQLDGGSTVVDFINLVCPRVPQHALTHASQANPRRALHNDISRFYQNRVLRPLSRREKATVRQLCVLLQGKPLVLSEYSREQLAALFRNKNEMFSAMSGVSADRLQDPPPSPAGALQIEALFSFKLQNLIAENWREDDIKAFVRDLEGPPPGAPPGIDPYRRDAPRAGSEARRLWPDPVQSA